MWRSLTATLQSPWEIFNLSAICSLSTRRLSESWTPVIATSNRRRLSHHPGILPSSCRTLTGNSALANSRPSYPEAEVAIHPSIWLWITSTRRNHNWGTIFLVTTTGRWLLTHFSSPKIRPFSICGRKTRPIRSWLTTNSGAMSSSIIL